MRRVITILAAAVILPAVSACGQKGPLYVPGVPANAPWPHPPAQPKPAPEIKAPDVPGTTDERR